ncbi:hypothetical protein KBC59_01670 [Patescibacteria group bacterium]|jgi:hypothetical protein|nr:hypothetical protein [Patescibacteria group bacterium]
MQKIGWAGIFWGLAIALQAMVYVILPSYGTTVFLSPDETAVAVSARSFADQLTMRLEDPLLKDLPWIRPRSWVTQGTAMVPVGFLGLPAILGLLVRLFGEAPLLLWTPLLVLSAIYPLWRFLRSFGKWGIFAGIATWLSFPTVILYANRGLFPNLTVACFSLWAAWLIWERRAWWKWALSGLLMGAAFTVRPIEAVWIVPWVAFAVFYGDGGWKKVQWKDGLAFILGFLPPISLALFAAWRTYGSVFAVGYFLRDTAPSATPPTEIHQEVGWPFGLHPRRMWSNFHAYVIGFMGPWFAASLIAGATEIRKRTSWPVMFLAAWTLGVGVLVYGQAQYIDHVDANVAAVGNSFLRYLLPVVPFFALGIAALAQKVSQSPKIRYGGAVVFLCATALVWLGNWTAIKRDDEGLFFNQQELARYAGIRAEAQKDLYSTAIILSDRSDKVFFPSFRVASPLPEPERIRDLVAGVSREVDVLLFSTTQDDAGYRQWAEAGIQIHPLFESKNQSLYLLTLPDDSRFETLENEHHETP